MIVIYSLLYGVICFKVYLYLIKMLNRRVLILSQFLMNKFLQVAWRSLFSLLHLILSQRDMHKLFLKILDLMQWRWLQAKAWFCRKL